MATMKTLNGYGFNATEFNGKTSDSYLQKTDTASDSAKLGGKAPEYYIQPRNLLDNSDFTNPVNQRRIESGSTVSEWTYFIDRWKSNSGSSGTVSFSSDRMTTDFNFAQVLNPDTVKTGMKVTLAAKYSDGTICVVSRTISRTNTWNWVTSEIVNGHCIGVSDEGDGISARAIIEAGTVEWAALYEGEYTADTLPPYMPKGYAQEFAECQRYFRKSFVGNSIPPFSEHGQVVIRAANENWLCSVNFDKPMRCAPSVIVYSPVSKQAGKVSRFSDDVEIDVGVAVSPSDFQINQSSAFTLYDAYCFCYIASSDL